jgi:hypothetical protein
VLVPDEKLLLGAGDTVVVPVVTEGAVEKTWTGAGALTEGDVVTLLEKAGFGEVTPDENCGSSKR